MCLAQKHNAVSPLRLESATVRSRVQHFTTKTQLSNSTNKMNRPMDEMYLQQGYRRYYADNRTLRSISNVILAVPKSKTAISDGSFSCTAPQLLNQLTDVTKNACYSICFKTQVK